MKYSPIPITTGSSLLRDGNDFYSVNPTSAVTTSLNNPGGDFSFKNWLLGDPTNGQAGNLGSLMQGITGLGQVGLGWKNYGLAKDQFNFSKDFSTSQFNNQVALTNQQMNDRERTRILDGQSAYTSLGDFKKANNLQKFGGN